MVVFLMGIGSEMMVSQAVVVLSVGVTVISVLIADSWCSRSGKGSPISARIHKTHHISIHKDIILTSMENLKGLFVKLEV